MVNAASDANANYINHFALVIDESSSMDRHARTVVQVVDEYVKFLARLSVQQDQETRVTVYTFSSRGREKCLFYDKDVLRTPSIAQFYRPDGMTALVDCVLLAIGELRQTAVLHGQHSFMVTVVSDGIENHSQQTATGLSRVIAELPDNWTTAAFGPNAHAVHSLKGCGFPAGNVSTWDTSSSAGVEEVGFMLRAASANLMEGRKHGIHGYNSPGSSAKGQSLFALRDFSLSEVRSAAVAMTEGSYYFLEVDERSRIDEFVAGKTGKPYDLGRGYYEWMETETVQPSKGIAVEVTEPGGKLVVYTGSAARTILGLPDGMSVRLKPGHKPGCKIFVQSKSPNRVLIPGTRLLMMR